MLIQEKPGYQPQAADTDIQSDRFFFSLLRQKTASERWQMGTVMIRQSRQFSLACLRKQFSHLSTNDFASKVAGAWLQDDCPPGFIPTGTDVTWIQDSAGLAGILHGILTELGIPYYVTGGMAAIAYGEPRTTRDLDIVLAKLDFDYLRRWATSLGLSDQLEQAVIAAGL